MKTANDAIVFALQSSSMMIQRFCEDLSQSEYLHRPFAGTNCAAWIVGHLTVSDCNVHKSLEVQPPVLPEGFTERFSREGSAPQASDFGDVTKLVPLFSEVRGSLIRAAQSASTELLQKALPKPFAMCNTVGEMMVFMAAHSSRHAGQIPLIRRSLGRPPLV